MRRAASTLVAMALLAATPRPAGGYEFAVRALTLGQGYQLRLFRPLSGDLGLNRRRFTQTLSLEIWGIGERRARLRAAQDTPPPRGPQVYVSAFLRLDHDFGEYLQGQIRQGNSIYDALDLVPELERNSLALDMLWLYAGARGVAGFVDLEVGRQLAIAQLDWWSFDGVTVRAHTPWRLAVEAFGGLRVRDSSPMGVAFTEPDGTGGGECAEYVEGPVPGSGSWRPIDRPVLVGEDPFEAEFDVCPQRDQRMATFGAAVSTAAGLPVTANLAYRRSVSRTPGVIGPVDRFEFPDLGYYPNDAGQAPAWGVNEELITATARAVVRFARGRGELAPFAATRFSLLHGLFDTHLAGARLRYGAHALSAEYYYAYPTFDGDSIFNAFSAQAYHDARLTYELEPSAAWSTYARGWGRAFREQDEVADAAGGFAGGAQLGARYRAGPQRAVRADLFYEDGYGGQRVGGYGSARWQVARDWGVASRVSVIYFDDDLLARLDGVTVGGQLGATYRVDEGIDLHLTLENNMNRYYDYQLRGIAVLDLAFEPEL